MLHGEYNNDGRKGGQVTKPIIIIFKLLKKDF